MPRYLIERRFHVGEDQMPDVNRKSKRIAQEHFPEIVWEHSHVAIDESGTVKTFCLYEAASEDDVRAHAKLLGLHDVDAIHEIVGDVTPADFPLSQDESRDLSAGPAAGHPPHG
jgi:uncharacterized protein DUF4242